MPEKGDRHFDPRQQGREQERQTQISEAPLPLSEVQRYYGPVVDGVAKELKELPPATERLRSPGVEAAIHEALNTAWSYVHLQRPNPYAASGLSEFFGSLSKTLGEWASQDPEIVADNARRLAEVLAIPGKLAELEQERLRQEVAFSALKSLATADYKTAYVNGESINAGLLEQAVLSQRKKEEAQLKIKALQEQQNKIVEPLSLIAERPETLKNLTAVAVQERLGAKEEESKRIITAIAGHLILGEFLPILVKSAGDIEEATKIGIKPWIDHLGEKHVAEMTSGPIKPAFDAVFRTLILLDEGQADILPGFSQNLSNKPGGFTYEEEQAFVNALREIARNSLKDVGKHRNYLAEKAVELAMALHETFISSGFYAYTRDPKKLEKRKGDKDGSGTLYGAYLTDWRKIFDVKDKLADDRLAGFGGPAALLLRELPDVFITDATHVLKVQTGDGRTKTINELIKEGKGLSDLFPRITQGSLSLYFIRIMYAGSLFNKLRAMPEEPIIAFGDDADRLISSVREYSKWLVSIAKPIFKILPVIYSVIEDERIDRLSDRFGSVEKARVAFGKAEGRRLMINAINAQMRIFLFRDTALGGDPANKENLPFGAKLSSEVQKGLIDLRARLVNMAGVLSQEQFDFLQKLIVDQAGKRISAITREDLFANPGLVALLAEDPIDSRSDYNLRDLMKRKEPGRFEGQNRQKEIKRIVGKVRR